MKVHTGKILKYKKIENSLKTLSQDNTERIGQNFVLSQILTDYTALLHQLVPGPPASVRNPE